MNGKKIDAKNLREKATIKEIEKNEGIINGGRIKTLLMCC